ncbi:Mg-dependent DNase [Peniophora sp. CONT]|nr:Mg-dependent DNase [Peniophora sp. CONT]
MSSHDEVRFVDIGVNLTDPVFRGSYRGRQKHKDDLLDVLERAKKAGVKSMIVTGGSLEESKEALALAREHNLYATVGCHPTRSNEFDAYADGADAYFNALDKLIEDNLSGPGRVVAVGECGLDYDRLHFSSAEIQQKYFRQQLALAKKHHLPLFLHSRSAHEDFVRIMREEGFGSDGGAAVGAAGGVVHSFTGSVLECTDYMDMGFCVGINGCSLKTKENLGAVRHLRLDKLMLETDAPWCSMTSTHASKAHLDDLHSAHKTLYLPESKQPEKYVEGKAVKGRNEPCAIGGVAWVVGQVIPDTSFEQASKSVWENTVRVFGLHELS